MGLLSKAAAGTGLEEKTASQGGLLHIINQKKIGTSPAPSLPSPSMEKAVMDMLSSGNAKFGEFQGIVLDAITYSAGEFDDRLSTMVSGFASAQGLAPGRSLVLFDIAQDRELIGWHLSKTVPGNTVFSFCSKSPQEAFSLLKPYL
jgi:hypothetical protein